MLKFLFRKYYENKEILNQQFIQVLECLELELLGINQIFENKKEIIGQDVIDACIIKNNKTQDRIYSINVKKFKRIPRHKRLIMIRQDLMYKLNHFEELVLQHNNNVALSMIGHAYRLIGNIEGRKLDQQQMLCIVKEAHNQLVIAGAGTGKTTTIIGKIKYLLKSNKYSEDQILALSFTNASATELSERIYAETSSPIRASTFHKLGLDIIRSANMKAPTITKIELRKHVKECLKLLMKSEEYLNLLNTYLLHNRVIPKSEFDFTTQVEYEEYLKLNPPKTLKNEIVKSYGEMDIANFLFQNGISYIYEHPYKESKDSDDNRSYKPDFYLPDYDIYIEYFGINRKGQVPSYFSAPLNMTATESYQASMQWKRNLHSQHNTLLIETYSYEKFEDTLIANLKSNLESFRIELNPKSTSEMWEALAGEGETVLNGLVEVFETVINLVKSNNYTFDEVRRLNIGNKNEVNNRVFIALCEPIFKHYNKALKDQNEIDFNDMINLATRYVKEGRYKNPYRYVIVDEYQDISKSRFLLLKALRESQDFNVFCVGDDWQSIYRFAGSDVGLILDFDKHWGPSIQDKIETTYRFNQSLIDISGQFIMQNPAQLRKTLKHNSTSNSFALSEINGYTINNAINFLVEKLKELPKGSSVIFIGRYLHDARVLSSDAISHRYNIQTKNVDVVFRSRTDLRMQFMTAHRSKGLQADYVVIINNKDGVLGFPSKIADAPILDLLLHNYEVYPFAEERRLYYVALTRAKKKVILLTLKNQESEFALYLKQRYEDEIKQERYSCPECGGKLVKKQGQYGEFYGCVNYRSRECRFTRKINVS